MTPNEIAAKAREMISGNRKLEGEMRTAWASVEDQINDHVLASKKKWTVYEAHHIKQVARLEMLTAFVEGITTSECAKAALARAGIAQVQQQ